MLFVFQSSCVAVVCLYIDHLTYSSEHSDDKTAIEGELLWWLFVLCRKQVLASKHANEQLSPIQNLELFFFILLK